MKCAWCDSFLIQGELKTVEKCDEVSVLWKGVRNQNYIRYAEKLRSD